MKRFVAIALMVCLFASACYGGYSFAETAYLKRSSECDKIPTKIIKKIPLPRWYHEGLLYDGKAVWVCNGMKGKIWMVDTSSGSITSEINPSGTFTEAITKGPDDYLFVTDWGQRLYKARLDGDKLNVESEISLAPEHPAGILWNGTKFFVITWKRSIFGTRFYILEIDTNLKITRKVEIKAIQEPDHLAWDGNYLWISSWYSRAVYKVDIDRWEIVGAFASPVSRTTGIAWDGKYFWLTGTHSDLYKLEVGI